MRLLQCLPGGNFELTFFDDDRPPPYAILSHTWDGNQEVTHHELVAGTGKDKTGFDKIRFCGEQATSDGLKYFWVDTCCIDKTDQVELNTAINSMFRWYQRASKCYVYLSDVSVPEEVSSAATFRITWADAFRRSRWFTRGWTLQELVAPASIEFFSKERTRLGSKVSLEQDIHKITQISVDVLRGQSLNELSIEERMSWAAHRTTSLKEDRVYCLLGIFGVFLPLIYGEGEAYATKRLREEIEKRQEGRGREHTNTSYYNAAQFETPTRAYSTVPFCRDPDFIDRGTLLDELQERCSVPVSRVALVGLGGVGKSQLAIEHCYRVAEQSPETSVFWVHASNAARFELSFRDIADSVKIEGRQDPQANICKLVHDWLRDSKNPWLLVLDNVDDARFLLHAPAGSHRQPTQDLRAVSRPLREYLPYCERGSMIITTRNREAALKLVEPRNIIAVEPMDKVQASALLAKKLGAQQTSSDLAGLAAVLEYMPLAIVQAAAYITQRAPRCSVAKYLDEFRKSERKRSSLLSHNDSQLRRDWEAKNSIIVTWQISFEYLQQTRPSAADLLSLMSFFDRQGIPEALLQSRGEHNDDRWGSDAEDDVSQSSAGEEEFERDVVTLRNLCFISVDTAGTSFEMHALVQLATRKWLAAHGKLEHWKQQFVSNLCAEFPTGEFENWAVCQTLFAHAKSAAEQQPEEESSKVEWATLLYHAAWYAEKIGNITDAVKLAKKSMKLRIKVLSQEHEDTLWSMAMVGSAYTLGGYWDDAEELEVQVMETRKKKLGADHPDTLTSMAKLASTYWNQGRWDDAEELFVQVIETRKKKLGADHPDTLTSMANLALTYKSLGRWDAAEELEVQVMETSKTKLGADHPDTLTSMGNLAMSYNNQGKWDDAEKLNVQVMETFKTKLGADHPNTLTSMGNLALIYQRLGRWDDAEKLEVQVIETRKTKFGADHPSTLTSMGNLALTYQGLGRWDAAEELEVEVMEKRKTKLGVDHPDTLTSMAYLASTYSNQGRWDDAEKLEAQVMEKRKTKLGVDHPDTLTSMAYLASTYSNQGRWEDAEKLEVEVLETRKTKLGADHPSTLTSMANLASTYWNQGRWDDAEELDVQVMETSKKKLGADHPDTLTSMANLASTYRDQERWDDAEELEVQVMETRKKKLGADHPDTLTSMNNLAFTWKGLGRNEKAICLMRECVKLRQLILRADHPDSISSSAALVHWEAEQAVADIERDLGELSLT